MTSLKKITLAGFCALTAFVGTSHATPVPPAGGFLSSYGVLSQNDFDAALGLTHGSEIGWAYKGSTATGYTLSFVGEGTGTFDLKKSNDTDSFGYSDTSYGSAHTVFFSSSVIGAKATINPAYDPFLFWFSDSNTSTNDAFTVYTDGKITPNNGKSAAAIDVFYNASAQTYALFYEDGGGSNFVVGNNPGNTTDADFNDFVVTYKVPEPASVALLGVGMISTGVIARRRRRPTTC